MAGDSEERARIKLELHDIRYDGQTLSGRLLVGAVEGRFRLDKRIIESVSLTTKSVTDCKTGQPVEFLVVDVLAARPRDEDVLTLESGYWYGKEVRIPLFTEGPGGSAGPECIEADMVFHALGGSTSAGVHVRAERTPLPSGPSSPGRAPEE